MKEQSDLGESGAAAIHREMERRNLRPLPAVRTISYILQRYGALDYRVRQRNLPPPLGWCPPDPSDELAEKLLERIRTEKARLELTKKRSRIKQQKGMDLKMIR